MIIYQCVIIPPQIRYNQKITNYDLCKYIAKAWPRQGLASADAQYFLILTVCVEI